MKLQLLSLNVRGLNEEAAVDTIQAYIRDSRPSPNIVALHEHKLCGQAMTQAGVRLWRQAKVFGLEASPGYGHGPLDAGAGRGGVMSFLHPRWTRHIGALGSLLENRVHCFILQGLLGGDVGFANIYAPNDSQTRCQLWDTMTRELPNTCRWMLMGDFNMVEHRADKTRQCTTLISIRECILFNVMKLSLHVADNPRSQSSLRFSWDNNRPGEHRTLARLDRLYFFQDDHGSADRTLLSYKIRASVTRFDHLPVLASVQLEDQPRRTTQWKMNAWWLDDAAQEIIRLWHAAGPRLSFFSKLRRIIQYYRGFCKQKAAALRADEADLI